jgi:hypothetical protein
MLLTLQNMAESLESLQINYIVCLIHRPGIDQASQQPGSKTTLQGTAEHVLRGVSVGLHKGALRIGKIQLMSQLKSAKRTTNAENGGVLGNEVLGVV